MNIDIIEAIRDPNLFRPFLQDRKGRLTSYTNWMVALRVLYGLPIKPWHHDLIRQCTGRDPNKLPKKGFNRICLITGRRAGKSKAISLAVIQEALFAGHEAKLSRGEQGIVAVCSPTRDQSQIVKGYLRGIFDTPLLSQEVVAETKNGFELANGIRIEILSGDHRTVRGFTLVAAVVDELAFFGVDESAKTKSDTELWRALGPSLATVGGRLIALTSPYLAKGITYSLFKKNYGNDLGNVLIWNAPSMLMNPTLDPKIIDAERESDLEAFNSEWMGHFRSSCSNYLDRATLGRLVLKNRTELYHQPDFRYCAFVDMAAGASASGDDCALAIAHADGDKVVLDVIRRYGPPPFQPTQVIRQMVDVLKSWGITAVHADRWGPGFVTNTFNSYGISVIPAKPKSDLYMEAMPLIASGKVVLLDNEMMLNQFLSLERRPRSGGRDVIDHPRGQHDDLCNAVAGALTIAARPTIIAGALGGGQTDRWSLPPDATNVRIYQ